MQTLLRFFISEIVELEDILQEMKHAYLILAHSNFGQLEKLVRMLDCEGNDIFIHIDRKAHGFDEGSFDGLCRHSELKFVSPRINVNWGGYSVARAELMLLETALAGGHYDYLHLLSGCDLPIKSQEYIHGFFEANAGKEFIDCRNVVGHTSMRYRYFTPFVEYSGFFLAHFLNNVVKYILKFLGVSMNRGIEFKCGSQWFSITEDFASYVVSKKDWIEKVFRHTNICDEVFIPTVFAASPFSGSGAGTNLRLIDWQRRENGHRHPHTFTTADLDELKASTDLFARKFDIGLDAEIIDRISGIW